MRSEVMSVSSVRLFRLALGTLLLLAGAALLVARGLAWLDLDPRMLRALEGGALCALGTALGAVPVLVIRNMPVALADTLLGFGAGVMLAATAFSLIMPAWRRLSLLASALGGRWPGQFWPDVRGVVPVPGRPQGILGFA